MRCRRCDAGGRVNRRNLEQQARALLRGRAAAVDGGGAGVEHLVAAARRARRRACRVPQRFVGLHFFSPVPAMKLVEVVASTPRHLPHAAVERVHELAQRDGQDAGDGVETPRATSSIACSCPYLLDGDRTRSRRAWRRPRTIDTAMRLGCGHPIGPARASPTPSGSTSCTRWPKRCIRELRRRALLAAGATCAASSFNNHLGKKTKLGHL